MSTRPPVSDADLMAQLRRRAGPQGPRVDTVRTQFIASVDNKIEAASRPAHRFPLPALASLAGVAVLVVVVGVVAVALPRLTPGAPSPAAPSSRPTPEAPPLSISWGGVRSL